MDDYTKLSRNQRRQKRKWKRSKKSLTFCGLSISLFTAIETLMAGIGTPFSIGVKTPLHGVFYCLKKIVTPLVRAFVMVARSGQPQGWPAPIPGSSNPLRVAAQSLEPLRGGYQSPVLE